MAESEIVLEVKNLTKCYKNRVAVDNISFEVYAGEIFGFLGPNGAGKSTTIKMITGLAKMTTGDVYICGKSITKDFENAIRNQVMITSVSLLVCMVMLQKVEFGKLLPLLVCKIDLRIKLRVIL